MASFRGEGDDLTASCSLGLAFITGGAIGGGMSPRGFVPVSRAVADA